MSSMHFYYIKLNLQSTALIQCYGNRRFKRFKLICGLNFREIRTFRHREQIFEALMKHLNKPIETNTGRKIKEESVKVSALIELN